ncbi:uncharacterized protein LOC105206304 [Solenopsis invicta]|uniref:uncharacterized protein LOC105206304 n=1 Tax=Solenopsis invicta TaxID=13686 RepID=UPI000E34015D|nr:uncharacterized protein LOC105206304 [Solenopsis invicta]
MCRYCCVCHKEQYKTDEPIIFHRFPSDPDTRKKWLEIIKRDDNKKRFVCSQHFKPEDYRMLCDRRQLLRKDAVPNINIPQLDAKVQLIKNEKQNSEQLPMECHKDMDDNIEDNNIENVPTSTADSLKRTNDSCALSTTPTKRHCTLQEFGLFRREDFTDEIVWNRFVAACKGLRKENMLLQYQNKRLLNQIQTTKDIIQELKKKNLITDSVSEMLSVS